MTNFVCGIYVLALLVTTIRCYVKYDMKLPQKPGLKYLSIQPASELPHGVDDARCLNAANTNIDKEVSKVTKYGTVRGRKVVLCDGPGVPIRERPGQPGFYKPYKRVNVFLGIPYAKPPTRKNNLQFKSPQPPEFWNDINSTEYKPSCPQNRKYMGLEKGINNTNEDCLYLNIFMPEENQLIKKYMVMVYIHGGNWDHGSANLFPAHMLAASQSVIVVTFNYRLGHLGFLSTGDSASVGNYGILDQVQAVKWIYENIYNFNGDPENITLFGIGTGAVSASLLAMSPLSSRMVRRVIAQDGASLADWAVIVDPEFAVNTSHILGQKLGCSTEDSHRLVDCISKRSNNEIRMLDLKPLVGWLPWGPIVDNFTVVDKPFLPKSPIDMLKESMPFSFGFTYLTGVSKDEGLHIMLNNVDLKEINNRITESIFHKKILDFIYMYNYTVNLDGVFKAISFMYKPLIDPTNETLLRQGYIDLLTDRYYNAPINTMAHILVTKKVPTYMYVLNYTFEGYKLFSFLKGITSETENLLLSGAPFMDSKFFPSNYNLQGVHWTEADRDMSQFMMEAWANFAKEGNPTPKRIFNKVYWERISEKHLLHLNLNSTNTSSEMIMDYKQEESNFWNNFLPFLMNHIPATLAPTLEPGFERLRLVTSALWGSVAGAVLLLIIIFVCGTLYCCARKHDSY